MCYGRKMRLPSATESSKQSRAGRKGGVVAACLTTPVLSISATAEFVVLIYPCYWASVVRGVAPTHLEDMSQRFSPNPGSVKHGLFAWFQQIGRLTKKARLPDW